MRRKRVSTRYIESEIRAYFDREVSRVKVPPVPVQSDVVLTRGNGEQLTGPSAGPSAGGSAGPSGPPSPFFRAAAAAVIIACLAGLYLVPVKQNELAEIVRTISEREALDEIVISGLQKAGRFLYENL